MKSSWSMKLIFFIGKPTVKANAAAATEFLML